MNYMKNNNANIYFCYSIYDFEYIFKSLYHENIIINL